MPGAEANNNEAILLDDSLGPSLDSEKEMEIINQGWKFVKDFLDNIESRNKFKINDKTENLIKDINNDICKYIVKNNSDIIMNELSKVTGTKPKMSENINLNQSNDETYNKNYFFSSDDTSNGNLIKLLSRLDNRKLPKLDIYNDENGIDFIKYLNQFEQYYQENFKGEKYLWIGELKDHLNGRMLEVFNSVRQVDDSYEDIKIKLVAWYNDEKDIREDRAKVRFEKAKKKNSENALMFSNNLLAMFKLAYPDKNYKKSNILINKLKSCLSAGLRNAINSQMMNFKMNDLDITWKDIQKVIRIYELQNKDENISDDDDKIVINYKDKSHNCNNDSNKTRPYQFYKPPSYLNNNYQNHANYQNTFRPRSPQFITPNDNQRSQFAPHVPHTSEFATPPYFMRPPFTPPQYLPPPMQNIQSCKYCRKIGHDISTCRSRLNLCFICGFDNHHYRQCSRYKPRDRRRYSVGEQPVNRRNETVRRLSNINLNQ